MMASKPKHQKQPPMYRLTLTAETFAAVVKDGTIKVKIALMRIDGKWDIGISMTAKDQIETAALPGENWSDTVKRMVTK